MTRTPGWRCLRGRSAASCDNLQTIPKAIVGQRPIGALGAHELPALDRALRYALGTLDTSS